MSSRVQNLQNNVQLIELYGKNLNPPSYHEIRIKYLKLEVQRTMKLVAEIKKRVETDMGYNYVSPEI
jgi:hypothetical protein